jgi:hypothetical protein
MTTISEREPAEPMDPSVGWVGPQTPQETVDALRHAEYVKPGGADSLYMKWQAGEATKDEWLAERERVRLLYPDPEE